MLNIGRQLNEEHDLPVGDHRISVIADPEQMVIEVEERRTNNRMDLDVVTV